MERVMFRCLLFLILSFSAFAEEFKLPEKGQKFTIEYTLEKDGEFTEHSGEIEFIQANIDYLVFNDKDNKTQKIPRTYVYPKYRKIFFLEDFKNHQKNIEAAEKAKALAAKAKERYLKFTDNEKIIYGYLKQNLDDFKTYLDNQVNETQNEAQKFKNRDIKEGKTSTYTTRLEKNFLYWKSVRNSFLANHLPSKEFLEYSFITSGSVYIQQVVDKKTALLKFHRDGDLMYATIDTNGYLDGKYYNGDGLYFLNTGTKTYQTAIGGTNTVKTLYCMSVKELSLMVNILKAMNGYR